jgi:hypothetical protein
MQFNKKAILATAGVLASVMGTATSVFAAGGYDENGNSAASGLQLPVYTSSSENSTSGSANAWSVATVYVKTGFLQLDYVPNLHFNNSFAGGTAFLKDNEVGPYGGTDARDGVQVNGAATGLLSVSDSRTTSGAGGNGGNGGTVKKPSNGWKLSLKVSEFKPTTSGSGTVPSGWTLRINRGQAAKNIINTGIQSFQPMAGVSDNLVVPNGASATAPIKDFTPGSSDNDFWVAAANTGAGTTSALINTPTSATLSIPTGVENGSYYSTLTWTLTAGVSGGGVTP